MSLTNTDSARFFGMDLSQWPAQWRAAADLLLGWPVLRRLVPSAAVALRQADGRTSTWLLQRGQAWPQDGAAPASATQALELPPERLLERRLTLPALSPADLARAIELDVASASPFGPEQTVWGHATRPAATAGLVQVDVAISSRTHIQQALQAAGHRPDAPPPEVWALPPGPSTGPLRPIVFSGWGEGQRQQRVQRGLRQRLLALGLLLALAAALVVTPTALLRARAKQADQSFNALQIQAGSQLAEREALMQSLDRLQHVASQLDRQLALPPVLDMLSRSLPDGAWLSALRMEGRKLTLNGQADDAAALVQTLASQAGAHDVRLASPATRRAGANKETFIIELQLDASHYGHSRAGPPEPPPADAPQEGTTP